MEEDLKSGPDYLAAVITLCDMEAALYFISGNDRLDAGCAFILKALAKKVATLAESLDGVHAQLYRPTR
jgi:hypothetical protein